MADERDTSDRSKQRDKLQDLPESTKAKDASQVKGGVRRNESADPDEGGEITKLY